MELYDQDGNAVLPTAWQGKDTTANSQQISLKGLPVGTYYLKVLSNHQDVTAKYKLALVL